MCMNAPKTPYEEVKTIVEQDLGRPIEEVFSGKKELSIFYFIMLKLFLYDF